MKMIVGLGNPGAEYRNTRHNVGFAVADRLAEEMKLRFGQRRFKSLAAEGRFEGESVLLLKPQTYMNLSGHAVRDAVRFHRVDLSDLLVIYDDLNLELGRIRIRKDGSHGGQNGLRSIIQELGTEAFPRVRIGVGHPGDAGRFRDHVLGNWEREEIPVIKEQIARAAEAVLCILREGLDPAMNRYNAKT